MDKYEYIKQIKERYSIEDIKNTLSNFKKINVMVIGDAIIDEYHFVTPKGRAIKDPILSVDYISHEIYAGGALAIANHISNFVRNVSLFTMLGDKDDRKDFIISSLNKNIAPIFFTKKNATTTIKKRYLNFMRNEKLFKVEHINDTNISEELETSILEKLETELPKYDLILVGDFGHSFITEKIINLLEKKSNYLAVNAQCNSANLGFNFITKYISPSYMTMDIQELRYAVADRFSDVNILAKKLSDKGNYPKFLVTIGKDGVDYFNNKVRTFFPAFITRPKDTVGAGDAVFSITALFAYSNTDDILPFVANCVGGIAVSYMGNSKFVTKEDIINFIEKAYSSDKRR